MSRSRSRSPPPRARSGSRDRGGSAANEEGGNTSLLVRNVPFSIHPDALKDDFAQHGDVRDVYIPKDFNTGQPRGFAFVEFLNHKDAEAARVAMDNHSYDGREITVLFAQEKRKQPSDMRRRDGYGKGGGYDRGGYDRGYDRGRGGGYGYDRGGYDRGGYDRGGRRDRSRSYDRRDDRRRDRSRSPDRRSRSPDRRDERRRNRSASRSRSRGR